ncbi:PEF-CTERM sorting domain-containing protein [Methanolobus sp. WCC5]|uniref:PEF-CTERM sorting domain-containing protein n=1 Tax=Methanolobus sp. WCC5 TaxID=3125785 RepID=UPI003244A8E5
MNKIITLLLVLSLLIGTGAAANNDLDTKYTPQVSVNNMKVAAAAETTIDNGDGTFTYTQTVNQYSTAPHYVKPANGGGFGIYSWWNQDYGWLHTFDMCSEPNMTINSVQLIVTAWDVDSDIEDGEYDHLTADGVDMNPVYLQGFNDEWSVTTFDVDPTLLMDDCELEIFMDIDMNNNYRVWATTLDKSQLIVVYSYGNNSAPYQPVVEKSPANCVDTEDDLVVTVIGPNPEDPDGDEVTYKYRWFVDIGTGGYLDDDFAILIDHTSNTVPAANTEIGQKWMVQVTPVDEHGRQGPIAEVEFGEIVEKCSNGGGSNGEEIPEFPTLILPVAAIIGLALVFQRSKKE